MTPPEFRTKMCFAVQKKSYRIAELSVSAEDKTKRSDALENEGDAIIMKRKITKKKITILLILMILFISTLEGVIYAVSKLPDGNGNAPAADMTGTPSDADQETSGADLKPSVQEPASVPAVPPETERQPETAAEKKTPAQTDSNQDTSQDTSIQPTTGKASVETSTVQKVTEKLFISNKADSFFQNSVFAGDSVMTGLQYYVMRQEKGFLADPVFLALNSFSAFWDLQPVTEKSIHPEYQGQKGTLEDLLVKINPEKVFLFFGINDLTMTGLNKAVENYKEVINRILQKNPKVQIYIISTTNMYKGSDKDNLTNKNIDALNEQMKSYCEQKGYGFIDITSYLTGDDGTLLEKYSADYYVHQTNAAYEVWVKVLRSYATEQINKAEEESRKAAEEESSRKAAEEESRRKAAEEESSQQEETALQDPLAVPETPISETIEKEIEL